jgi:hypothetical protein
MQLRMLLATGAMAVALSGCINLPQTKALITPVGVVGIHNFAPSEKTPRAVEFEQRRVAQRLAEQERQHQERS